MLFRSHIGHYSQDAAHSPINIGGADYHAPYTEVAIEDQHVPYQQMNTSDANYNPIKHVAQRLLVLSLKLSMTKPPLRELLLIPMIYNAWPLLLKMRSIHYQEGCGPWIVMTNSITTRSLMMLEMNRSFPINLIMKAIQQ